MAPLAAEGHEQALRTRRRREARARGLVSARRALGDVRGDVDRVLSLEEVGRHRASLSREADLVEDDVLNSTLLEALRLVLLERLVEVRTDLSLRPRVLQL